jgi:hypothetical protein
MDFVEQSKMPDGHVSPMPPQSAGRSQAGGALVMVGAVSGVTVEGTSAMRVSAALTASAPPASPAEGGSLFVPFELQPQRAIRSAPIRSLVMVGDARTDADRVKAKIFIVAGVARTTSSP